jgi:hypothetical protein
VRTDLPIAQHAVQSLHAALSLASIIPIEGIPNVVYIGVPDVPALLRVKAKLEKHQIPKYCYEEPDYDYGFTAIATAPLDDEQRRPLRNYQVWKEGGSKTREEPTHRPAGSLLTRAPNTPVAQSESAV